MRVKRSDSQLKGEPAQNECEHDAGGFENVKPAALTFAQETVGNRCGSRDRDTDKRCHDHSGHKGHRDAQFYLINDEHGRNQARQRGGRKEMGGTGHECHSAMLTCDGRRFHRLSYAARGW